MKFNLPTLEFYFNENDTLCGYVFNHPEFENGDRIRSNYFDRFETWIDLDGQSYKVAICAGNEKFRLGQPMRSQSELDDFRRGAEMPKMAQEMQRDRVSDLRRVIG